MTDKTKYHKVVDSSCTAEYPVRYHEIQVHGEWYRIKFEFGVETIMPFDKAAKFLQAGFVVTDHEGSELSLPSTSAAASSLMLAGDEVVAKMSELTLESLKVRAAQKKGGEMFLDAPAASRPDIIKFILGQVPVAADAPAEVNVSTIDDEENLLEEGEGTPEVNLGNEPLKVAEASGDTVNGSQAEPVIIAEAGALELAAANGIDLAPYDGKGSGIAGQITVDDVQGLIDHLKNQAAPEVKAE